MWEIWSLDMIRGRHNLVPPKSRTYLMAFIQWWCKDSTLVFGNTRCCTHNKVESVPGEKRVFKKRAYKKQEGQGIILQTLTLPRLPCPTFCITSTWLWLPTSSGFVGNNTCTGSLCKWRNMCRKHTQSQLKTGTSWIMYSPSVIRIEKAEDHT